MCKNVGPFVVQLFPFSHTAEFLSVNVIFKVMPQHINVIEIQTWTRPLLNLTFVRAYYFSFCIHFWCDEWSPTHFPERSSVTKGNSWFHELKQVLPVPAVPKKHQTITLPPPCSTVGMKLFLWNVLTWNNRKHPKSNLFHSCPISLKDIYLKFWGSSSCSQTVQKGFEGLLEKLTKNLHRRASIGIKNKFLCPSIFAICEKLPYQGLCQESPYLISFLEWCKI